MKRKGRLYFFNLSANSLRIQLLSRSLLILAVLLGMIGLFQYVFMKDVIYKNKASAVRSQIMSLPRPVLEQLRMGTVNNNQRLSFILPPDVSAAFIDADGHYSVLSDAENRLTPPRLDIEEYWGVLKKRDSESSYRIVESGGAEQLLVLQPFFEGPGPAMGVIQVSTLTGPLKELLVRQLLTFLLLSLTAMVFGLLGFLPVIRKTLVPLFNMVNTAGQIDAGNLERRFPTCQGQMEIDRLAESFNGMLERLEASFKAEKETQEKMRRFIADASHELRTPLTSIHGFLEVLLRGAADQPDQLQKALKSMHGESERMNKLVHDLLLLARLDRTPHIELTEGLLDEVLNEMEPQLRILAGSRKLIFQIEANMKSRFNTYQIKQVVLNLFNNAVKNTDPEKGCIQVSLGPENDGVQLSFQDNGQGISDTHLPHIFDRFYRSDSSRIRKYGGFGLGLSITKSIVEVHGGTITVTSQEGKGSTFCVWLPGSTCLSQDTPPQKSH